MKLPIVLACLLITACARPSDGNSASFDVEGAGALTPGTKPVVIGEGGANFAACATTGRVVNLSPSGVPYLVVKAAPFAEAQDVARLENGARLFVCTRSIDQKWQGVVLPPDGASADAASVTDCGVSTPVAAPGAYHGPCRSGWVSSDFVRLGAN